MSAYVLFGLSSSCHARHMLVHQLLGLFSANAPHGGVAPGVPASAVIKHVRLWTNSYAAWLR